MNNSKETMSSKERVENTFNFSKTDRVPINYFANSGIDLKLKKHFNLKIDDNEGLRRILGVDFRAVDAPYIGKRLHKEVKDRIVDPQWGIHMRYIKHSSGQYLDFCDFPLKDADIEKVANWPMPSPDDYDYKAYKEMCKRYEGYAMHLGNPGLSDIMNSNGMLRSYEKILMDLALDDEAGLLLIDRKLKIQLEVLQRMLEMESKAISFVWIGEDLGTQIGPLISMDLFRKHIRPRMQKFIDLANAYDKPVMIHSCGSSSYAFNDLIEMGIRAVDTLQPEAKDMSPAYLKKTFGNKLVFHGCISTAGEVAYGNTIEVEESILNTLKIMMNGGGYCFAPTHSLQDNSPLENVIKMYECAHKYGNYS